MANNPPIGPGTKVTLYFSLKLEGGELVDSTGSTAATFVVGDGKLLPGFERAMFGLKTGAVESFKIEAESAFGQHNPSNVQRMRRSQFQVNMALSEGLMMSFADPQNAELPGVITKVQGESVEIDFNHPLAGKDIIFDVEILEVKQITNEILRVSADA